MMLMFSSSNAGKTTSAASLGVGLADAGLRVLVLSTDPAHSLGDALLQPLSGTPARVDLCAPAGEGRCRRGASLNFPSLQFLEFMYKSRCLAQRFRYQLSFSFYILFYQRMAGSCGRWK
jgi:hypothetical protein